MIKLFIQINRLKRKACLTLGFFYLLCSVVYSQDQTLADSLESVYLQGNYDKHDLLEILKELAVNHTDTEKKLAYSLELMVTAQGVDSINYLFQGLLEKGNALRLKSELSQALESYFQAAKIAEEEKLIGRLGAIYISIGDVYSIMGNHNNAVNYYLSGIDILKSENDSIRFATALLNAGDEYFNYGELDTALIFFKESEEIFNLIGYKMGVAYNLGNVGMVLAEQGQDDLAETNINEAITILEELQDYYPISVYLTYMSDIYLKKGEEKVALSYALRSLELAEQYGLKEQISDANLKLSELHEKSGHLLESYKYYKNHIAYRDSVKNIESVQKMADLRTNYEVSQKQVEVDLLNEQKRNQQIIVIATFIALFLIGMLAFGLYRRSLFIQKTSRIIEEEKDRSEALLLNILPAETARELKEHGKIKAKKFDLVTVLFTDFKGFTEFAEHEDPEHLVKSIDFYFKAFDEITTKFGLEKIKTIGDAYMCAGGLPTVNQTHARDVIYAAKEIIELVQKEYKANDDLIHFEIRIGVHTGPVIAGIVGIKKWQYDIWGDTVNIASRMESRSEPGKVNLSEATYNEIKDEFSCDYRGEVEVKNRGALKMFFLS